MPTATIQADYLTQLGAQRNTYGYDVGAKWEGMGFMAAVTYNWAQIGDYLLDAQVDNLRVGGMYTAGWGSIRAMWEQTQLDTNSNLLFNNTKQQKYGLGGTFNLGKATLLAQWYAANDADNMGASGVNFYEVGALYNLSKRTMLKATWAMVDNDSDSGERLRRRSGRPESAHATLPPQASAGGYSIDQRQPRLRLPHPGCPGWCSSRLLIRSDRLENETGASAPVFRFRHRCKEKGASRGALFLSRPAPLQPARTMLSRWMISGSSM